MSPEASHATTANEQFDSHSKPFEPFEDTH